jgi:hypothetical protein
MIKNKEEFKNYNIVCTNEKEVKKTMDFLKNLDFKVEDKISTRKDYIFVYFDKQSYKFACDNWCKLNQDNISFYNFRKLAKNLLKKKEKEKKLEDFEVANDGRITKINNWKSGKKVFLVFGYDNIVDGFKQSFLETYIKLGLIYATKETRDKAQFKLEIETKLKNIAERLNGKEKIDWESEKKTKYYIVYDFINNSLKCGVSYTWKEKSTIYCLTENFLIEAKKEIGKENLIKYFKD